MEHAVKMVLVPADNLPSMTTPAHHHHTPIMEQEQCQATLSRLDAEMTEILHSRTFKDEREKWTAYLAVLQRYLHFADSERAQQYLAEINDQPQHQQQNMKKRTLTPTPVTTIAPSAQKFVESAGLDDSIIIESVPQKYRVKAKLLLRRLHQTAPEKLTWNGAGVVTIKGQAIHNSNIVDLVNDAMRRRKSCKPEGRKVFARLLREIQTPREFIGNKDLWRSTSINANSTLLEEEEPTSSRGALKRNANNETVELSDDDDQSEFYSGSDHKSDSSAQNGSGCRNNNKQKRVIWSRLKL